MSNIVQYLYWFEKVNKFKKKHSCSTMAFSSSAKWHLIVKLDYVRFFFECRTREILLKSQLRIVVNQWLHDNWNSKTLHSLDTIKWAMAQWFAHSFACRSFYHVFFHRLFCGSSLSWADKITLNPSILFFSTDNKKNGLQKW